MLLLVPILQQEHAVHFVLSFSQSIHTGTRHRGICDVREQRGDTTAEVCGSRLQKKYVTILLVPIFLH